jgi:crotonobetainyl-CoA:carnitine CoA-transferase CaiB-like acyl-CoA transferase
MTAHNGVPGETPTGPPGDGHTGALSGLLVADFGRVLAGPYLTMLMADLGATVIKVEPATGDQTRSWGPPWNGEDSTYYLGVNRGKQSIVLDLTASDDRRLAVELATRADVLVENFMPGRMARFGLDYDTLSTLNPRLIYCSLTGFGAQAEGAQLPGFDLVAQAVGGLMSITGDPTGPATKVGVAVIDVLCGLHALAGILAALHARTATGRGQLVETNLMLSALSALTNQASAYLVAGVVPTRLGNAHPSVAPYETYPVGDGEVVIAVGTDRQFRDLCLALGLESLVNDERFATNPDRSRNRIELRELLHARLQHLTQAHALSILAAAAVPCGPVNDIAQAFEYAERLKLNAVWSVGGVPQVRTPFHLSDTPPRPTSVAPQLNETGTEIRQWLESAAAGQ